MREYETVFITKTDVVDEKLKTLVARIKAILVKSEGTFLKIEEWGKRKFAYEIEKTFKGNYFLLRFAGAGNLVKELERNFKIFDDVIRWHTLVLNKDANLDELKTKYNVSEGDQTAEFIPAKLASTEDVAETAEV